MTLVSFIGTLLLHWHSPPEIADVDKEDGEDQQWADVSEDSVLGGGGVLLPAPVVQRVEDSHVLLNGDPDCHVDGAHQRDRVQGGEKVVGEHEMVVCIEFPQGLDQHGH